MIRFTVDANDSGMGGACNTCCCQPLPLKPGETDLLVINYAPWSVPIGGRGLVPTPEITITPDDSACSSGPINGVAPPTTGNVLFNSPQNIAVNTAVTWDLRTDTFPTGGQFEYRLVPVSGPLNGTLRPQALDGSVWTYTGNPGFNGYDQFWVKITDAQGRSIIRAINLRVGTPSYLPPPGWGVIAGAQQNLVIDRAKLQLDARLHQLSVPIMLLPNGACDTIEGCIKYRVSIKAFASDCDRIFSRIDCFDAYCRKC